MVVWDPPETYIIHTPPAAWKRYDNLCEYTDKIISLKSIESMSNDRNTYRVYQKRCSVSRIKVFKKITFELLGNSQFSLSF